MTPRRFLDDRVTLYAGDCVSVLAALPEASVDSVVCDPPYHLTSIVKRYGQTNLNAEGTNEERARSRKDGYGRLCGGFMGKQWDGGDIAQRVELWELVLRVLKPGGHLIAFSGTRTYHRMAVAIEDAGFEIRDQIGWTFGSGFPKSHNAGNGWGTALKPAWEPIVLARKPLIGTVAENVLRHGTGAINVDGCRIEGAPPSVPQPSFNSPTGNVYGFQTGEGRIGEMSKAVGRWPANLVHDGSEEVLKAFPDTTSGALTADQQINGGWKGTVNCYGTGARGGTNEYGANAGSAARFFYTAKADSEDRLGSKHPTVKPLDLMQWLVRLVTPRGGTCLDPFAGTGTTGEAAWREGMNAILIEREEEYLADIARRMELATQPTKRAAVAKTKNKLERPEDLPLFAITEPSQ